VTVEEESCKIRGSHSSEHEDYSHQGCDLVPFDRKFSTLRRNVPINLSQTAVIFEEDYLISEIGWANASRLTS
jgi:hypothetical protein